MVGRHQVCEWVVRFEAGGRSSLRQRYYGREGIPMKTLVVNTYQPTPENKCRVEED